jgi:hypothetical protein
MLEFQGNSKVGLSNIAKLISKFNIPPQQNPKTLINDLFLTCSSYTTFFVFVIMSSYVSHKNLHYEKKNHILNFNGEHMTSLNIYPFEDQKPKCVT